MFYILDWQIQIRIHCKNVVVIDTKLFFIFWSRARPHWPVRTLMQGLWGHGVTIGACLTCTKLVNSKFPRQCWDLQDVRYSFRLWTIRPIVLRINRRIERFHTTEDLWPVKKKWRRRRTKKTLPKTNQKKKKWKVRDWQNQYTNLKNW